MTGVIDNVDFTLRDDSTSVTMLIPPDTPVGTRTIIIPPRLHLAEHRIIREAIADALADHGRNYEPEKPDALLWMDVETTGLDANKCSILKIGLRCTSLDAMHEYGRFEAVVHIGRETLLTVQPSALELHLNNGLLAQCESCDPLANSPRVIAEQALWFIQGMAATYTLHPAGTNISRFDLPMVERFCMTGFGELFHYRMLDVTALRLAAKACGQDPYQHRMKPTHRVHDCLDRDIAEYRHYLTLMTGPRSQKGRP